MKLTGLGVAGGSGVVEGEGVGVGGGFGPLVPEGGNDNAAYPNTPLPPHISKGYPGHVSVHPDAEGPGA